MDSKQYTEYISNIKNQLQKAIDELCETADIITAELENISGTNMDIPESIFNKAAFWEANEVKTIYQNIKDLHDDVTDTVIKFQEVNFAKYDVQRTSNGTYAVSLDDNDTREMKHRAALMLGSPEEKVSFADNPFFIVKDNDNGKLYAKLTGGNAIPLPLNNIEKYDAGTIAYIEDRRILAREQESKEVLPKRTINREMMI